MDAAYSSTARTTCSSWAETRRRTAGIVPLASARSARCGVNAPLDILGSITLSKSSLELDELRVYSLYDTTGSEAMAVVYQHAGCLTFGIVSSLDPCASSRAVSNLSTRGRSTTLSPRLDPDIAVLAGSRSNSVPAV